MGDTERYWRFGQRVKLPTVGFTGSEDLIMGSGMLIIVFYILEWASSLVAQILKNLPAMWETWVQSLG